VARWIIGLTLIAATLIVYAQALRFDFVSWDDPIYVTQNPQVRAGLTLDGVRSAFSTGERANWHPLVTLSHMLDCELFGLGPAGHHATNVLLHLANTLILFRVLDSMTSAVWASAWVAALFALHPLHVEPVAWVSARKDVLSTLFGFLSLWAYVAYARRGGAARYLLTALLLALGLMAKPMLVTFPLLFLLLDYWPLARLRVGRSGARPDASATRSVGQALLEKVPLLVLAAGSSVLTLAVQRRAWTMPAIGSVPLAPRAANAAVSYVRYIGKLLWPSDLAVLYPHPNLPGGTPWAPWQVAGAAALLATATVLVLRARRPYLVVGWLWYVITLVPVSGLVPFGFEAMADRFTYVPLVGLLIAVAWGGRELVARWRPMHPVVRPAAAVAASAAALASAACSASQLGCWRDSIALYRHSLEAAPGPPVIHYNLANALDAQGQPWEAIHHYREAVRRNPSYSEAHNNLGVTLAAQGRVDEAIAHYREALRQKPHNAQAHNNLGFALEGTGRREEAIGHYREAVRIEPPYALAHLNLARVLHARGELEEAIAHYREALRLRPDLAPAERGLDAALRAAGARQRAQEEP
jgi:tetratricopeptide (TPR) repeat protein